MIRVLPVTKLATRLVPEVLQNLCVRVRYVCCNGAVQLCGPTQFLCSSRSAVCNDEYALKRWELWGSVIHPHVWSSTSGGDAGVGEGFATGLLELVNGGALSCVARKKAKHASLEDAQRPQQLPRRLGVLPWRLFFSQYHFDHLHSRIHGSCTSVPSAGGEAWCIAAAWLKLSIYMHLTTAHYAC